MGNKLNLYKIIFLGPLAFLYGTIVWIRNFCYDNNIFKSKEFDIPIVSLGNISVGGTGKTPHAEYIFKMLKDEYSVAILSRGYKRKTSGFRIVEDTNTALEVGDEPLQMKLKYPQAIVAVDAKRIRGIDILLKKFPELNLIILDDGFQHRKVKPGLSILLNNFNNPISKDFLLPLGRLRESKSSIFRAHIIFITKCPENLKPIERRIMQKEMEVLPFQYLFFSTIKYKEPTPAYKESLIGEAVNLSKLSDYNVCLFTGIAKDNEILGYLKPKCKSINHLRFSDHKNYKAKHLENIKREFENIPEPKILISTEKDFVRFKNNNIFPDELKKYYYYIPIEVDLIASEDERKTFNNQIYSYVRNNKRYSKLYKNAYSG